MNILAVGQHPDDIEFGCGATLIQYVRSGHDVSMLVLTEGGFGGQAEVRVREQEAAAKLIGAQALIWGGFRDTELVCGRQLIQKIEQVVNQTKPDVVFLTYLDDIHQDHRAAAQAGISATRYVREVLFYEVPTTQHFEPVLFINIETVLDAKVELLKCHASQVNRTKVENLTIMDSVLSCATFRGYQGRTKFAEGFQPLRCLRNVTDSPSDR